MRILHLLGVMELSVGELAQAVGQSQPRVSRLSAEAPVMTQVFPIRSTPSTTSRAVVMPIRPIRRADAL